MLIWEDRVEFWVLVYVYVIVWQGPSCAFADGPTVLQIVLTA